MKKMLKPNDFSYSVSKNTIFSFGGGASYNKLFLDFHGDKESATKHTIFYSGMMIIKVLHNLGLSRQ